MHLLIFQAGAEKTCLIQNRIWSHQGFDILAPSAGGGYTGVTGTSFATPFVTGAAALMMEWGITRRNDPFLWGEKVKAYLRRGAQPRPGFCTGTRMKVWGGEHCVQPEVYQNKDDKRCD